MSKNTQTILIVAGLAVAAYLAYQYIQSQKTNRAPNTQAPGAASNVPANSNTGGNWWDTLRTDFTGALDTVEGQYKSLGQNF